MPAVGDFSFFLLSFLFLNCLLDLTMLSYYLLALKFCREADIQFLNWTKHLTMVDVR